MSDAPPPSKALTYSHYLRIDPLLELQQLRSGEHDEMLFIIIHQVYELWFKQIIHETPFLQQALESCDTARSLSTFNRILTILKTLVGQVDGSGDNESTLVLDVSFPPRIGERLSVGAVS